MNENQRNKESMNAIREDIILSSLRYRTGTQQSIGNVIQSIASSLFYNYFQMNSKFEYDRFGHGKIFLFDRAIHSQKEFENELLSVVYCSYRNSFFPFYSDVTKSMISSDCGWGCMIRSAQMILARGLFELKKTKLKGIGQSFQYNSILRIKEELICLFNDISIPIECVISLEDFAYFAEGIELIAKKDKRYAYIEDITPPFSIQTICKVSNNAGNWTSSLRMINAFIEINRYLFNRIAIVHYADNCIRESDLYKAFCKEATCDCDINALNDEKKLCQQCRSEFPIEGDDRGVHKGWAYRFNREGILFVTLRLGLRDIEQEYIEDVKGLFSLKNNIGFIGGKKDRAYYFIGSAGGQFLLLDPHLNQQAIDVTSKDYSSYSVKDVYLLDPSELSAELTVGFCVKSAKDLREFIQENKNKKNNRKNYIITISE